MRTRATASSGRACDRLLTSFSPARTVAPLDMVRKEPGDVTADGERRPDYSGYHNSDTVSKSSGGTLVCDHNAEQTTLRLRLRQTDRVMEIADSPAVKTATGSVSVCTNSPEVPKSLTFRASLEMLALRGHRISNHVQQLRERCVHPEIVPPGGLHQGRHP